jgi:hypothetical protein
MIKLLPHLKQCSACRQASPAYHDLLHAMESLKLAFHEYWDRLLANTLEHALGLGLDVRISTKPEYIGANIHQQLLEVVFVLVRSQPSYGREEWAEFFKWTLRQLVVRVESISTIPLSSECSPRYPELYGERHNIFDYSMWLRFRMSYAEITNAGITADHGLDKWIDEAVALLDSKFPVLDLGLRDKVGFDRDTDSLVFTLTNRL